MKEKENESVAKRLALPKDVYRILAEQGVEKEAGG